MDHPGASCEGPGLFGPRRQAHVDVGATPSTAIRNIWECGQGHSVPDVLFFLLFFPWTLLEKSGTCPRLAAAFRLNLPNRTGFFLLHRSQLAASNVPPCIRFCALSAKAPWPPRSTARGFLASGSLGYRLHWALSCLRLIRVRLKVGSSKLVVFRFPLTTAPKKGTIKKTAPPEGCILW